MAATRARGQDGREGDLLALAGVSTAEPYRFRGGRIGEHCCPASHLPSTVIKTQPRANIAATPQSPRTMTSAHRTDVDPLVRMRCEKVRIPRGKILRRCRHADRSCRPPVGNCGRFQGRLMRARRKDTWWRGRFRARACRKHRAGSGPLPRQIRPTRQRRRCGRGRGRGALLAALVD